MKKNSLLIILVGLLILLTSCQIETLEKQEYVDKLYHYHVLQEKDNACVDLRSLNESYAQGHLKGFVNYDFKNGSEEEFINYMEMMYSKDIYIFLIDDDGNISKEAATMLKKTGYKHIITCNDGYNQIEEIAKEYMQIITGIDDCGC